MSFADLKEAVRLVETAEDADFEGAKSADLIRKAENRLGVIFPPTYREFLKKLGCGDVGGEEFFGLIGDQFENSGVPDAVWLTLSERDRAELPPPMVLVYARGDGVYCALDTSRTGSDGECPVVEWVPGVPDGRGGVVASDFGAFLLHRVREALSD